MSIVNSTHRNGYSLTVEQELVEVPTMGHPFIREDWTYVDKKGHTHGPLLLLADWVVLGTYWCDTCRDEHEDAELRCIICGEEIVPEYGWSSGENHTLPGLRTVTLKTDDGRIYRLQPEDVEKLQTAADMDSFAMSVISSRVPDWVEMNDPWL